MNDISLYHHIDKYNLLGQKSQEVFASVFAWNTKTKECLSIWFSLRLKSILGGIIHFLLK